MAMSKREKMIAIGTGAAFALFVGDRYALTPYVDASREVTQARATVTTRQESDKATFDRQKRLDKEWRAMLSGGLKANAGEAEQQLYEAVRGWAREAGVTVQTSDPQRVPQKDRTQLVKLRVTGTGTTASVAKLLSKVESSAMPVKVDEFTLTSRTQGNDDLSVMMTVSTIWIRPPSPEDAKRPGLQPRRAPGAAEDL